MYPKKAWKVVGGYPEEMVYGREDWAFNIRLGEAGFCGLHIGNSGNLYRREGQNRSLRTGNRHKGEPEQKPFNWRRLFMDQLRSLYPDLYAGARPMGCCGGRSSKKVTVSKTGQIPLSAAQIRSVPQGRILLEYIGGNSGKTPWYVENRRYIFGGVGPAKVQSVLKDDADELLKARLNGRPQFRRYKMPAKQPKVPIEKRLEANPIVPDNFAKIEGIGIMTEEKLKEAGYTTFLELSRQNPEKVAENAGITLRLAKISIEGAKEYV
jgi:predicted flap endonuclease-1-like 5' DNA nuclease